MFSPLDGESRDRRFLALLGGTHWASRNLLPGSWVDVPPNCSARCDYGSGEPNLLTREEALAEVAEFNRERTEMFGGDPVDVDWAVVAERSALSTSASNFFVVIEPNGEGFGMFEDVEQIRYRLVRPTDDERCRYAIADGDLVTRV